MGYASIIAVVENFLFVVHRFLPNSLLTSNINSIKGKERGALRMTEGLKQTMKNNSEHGREKKRHNGISSSRSIHF